jgi:hypothetical protein
LLDQILNLRRIASALAEETDERRVETPRETIQAGADSLFVSLHRRSVARFLGFCSHWYKTVTRTMTQASPIFKRATIYLSPGSAFA